MNEYQLERVIGVGRGGATTELLHAPLLVINFDILHTSCNRDAGRLGLLRGPLAPKHRVLVNRDMIEAVHGPVLGMMGFMIRDSVRSSKYGRLQVRG